MKLILTLLLLLPVYLKAQIITDNPVVPYDSIARKINYTGIIHVDSLSKEQIYRSAKAWLIQEFEFAHGQIAMDDENSGRIIARGTIFGKNLKGLLSVPFSITFIIDIRVKNGRYKYELTDFTVLAGVTDEMLPDWRRMDIYVTDAKYRNRKGEYSGVAKQHLGILDGNARMIVNGLKDAVAHKVYYYKSNDDF
jgi:hypothetical protein